MGQGVKNWPNMSSVVKNCQQKGGRGQSWKIADVFMDGPYSDGWSISMLRYNIALFCCILGADYQISPKN